MAWNSPKVNVEVSGLSELNELNQQKQEELFHELARELKLIRQHQEIATGIEFTEDNKE